MLTGAELIVAERVRQMEHKGYTTAHDEAHDAGDLAVAAACYAVEAYKVVYNAGYVAGRDGVPLMWPWYPQDWKPTSDVVRMLVKAGALIAAEIDRLQRLKVLRERGGEGKSK